MASTIRSQAAIIGLRHARFHYPAPLAVETALMASARGAQLRLAFLGCSFITRVHSRHLKPEGSRAEQHRLQLREP